MAGQRNKYAFKFLLQLLILSQKHILGVKKVVWGGLDVVWGGLEVVWGGLGCFGVVWGVSTDPSDLGQYCSEYRPPNFIKQKREQTILSRIGSIAFVADIKQAIIAFT